MVEKLFIPVDPVDIAIQVTFSHFILFRSHAFLRKDDDIHIVTELRSVYCFKFTNITRVNAWVTGYQDLTCDYNRSFLLDMPLDLVNSGFIITFIVLEEDLSFFKNSLGVDDTDEHTGFWVKDSHLTL